MPVDIDWVALRRKLPMEKTSEQRAQRFELFKAFDPNANGYLSLAEVDKGIRDILGLEGIFDCKPVIIRAFNAAKSANNKRGRAARGPDYVEKCEFRLLLVYLRQYFELWQMFDEIDSSDDRRVSPTEFKLAVPKLAEWGVEVTDPEATFKEIDGNGGGMILFNEFAAWALEKSLDLADDDD